MKPFTHFGVFLTMGSGKISQAGILVAVVLIGVVAGSVGLPLWSAMLEVLRNSLWQRGGRHPAANGIVNNLRMIEGAKDQWALEQKQTNGSRLTWADLAPYLKGGTIPSSLGESYYLNDIGTPANVRLITPLGTYQAGSSITVQ